MDWIGEHWLEVSGYIAIAVAVLSAINAATQHWSTIEGPWYRRLLPTLILLLTELGSIAVSANTRVVTGRRFKLPLTSSPPVAEPDEDGGWVVEAAILVVLSAALCIVVALYGGCANNWKVNTARSLHAAGRTAVAAHQQVITAGVCDDVIRQCVVDNKTSTTCEPFKRCVANFRTVVRILESVVEASRAGQVAVKAAGIDPKAEDAAQKYLNAAVAALHSVVSLLKTWGIDLPIPGV